MKIQLELDGHVVAISELDFGRLVENLSQGYYILAEACHRSHISGFADMTEALLGEPHIRQQRLGKELEPQISDEELRSAFSILREHEQEMAEVDERITEWLAGYVHLPPPQSKRERRRLTNRLHKIVSGHPGGVVGPVWSLQPEYQILAEKSSEVMRAVSESHKCVQDKIQTYLKSADASSHASGSDCSVS
jgi:hypothetical protein